MESQTSPSQTSPHNHVFINRARTCEVSKIESQTSPYIRLQTGQNLRGLRDGVTTASSCLITWLRQTADRAGPAWWSHKHRNHRHQVLLPGSARMQTGENLRVTNIATTYIMYYYQAPPDLQTGENLWGLKDGVADITPHQTLQTG